MKKLHYYTIIEFFKAFMLGVFIFTFMFIIFQIMDLMDMIISKGVPPKQVLFLFIYILPSFLAITIPMAVLTGVFMTFAKLAQYNEITALKSAGISLFKIITPVLCLSIILSFLMIAFNDKVLSAGNKNFRNLYFKIVYERVQVAIKEKVFISDFPGYIIYVEHIIPKTSKFENVKILKMKGSIPQDVIFAESGELISDRNSMNITLNLFNGTIHQVAEKENEYHHKIKFDRHWINMDLNNYSSQKLSSPSTSEMDIKELKKEIQNAPQEEKNILEVELQKKISIPFACFAFTLIGAPLGVMIKKSGKSVGFGISLCLIVIYYVILIAGVALGERGRIAPWIAIWSPNFILSIIGIVLLIFAVKDISIFD